MTHPGRSRKGDTRPTLLLSPKLTTLFGTWNVKTVYEALKAAQIAAEMTTFKLSILAINGTRWIESGCIRLATGHTVLYSGHDHTNTLHREGVGFVLTPPDTKSLIG